MATDLLARSLANSAKNLADNIDYIQFDTTNEPLSGDHLAYNSGALQWIAPSGGINPLGIWDALNNNPALTSSVGTDGDFYVVSVAGTTTLDGESEWNIGDRLIFGSTVWNRIPVRATSSTPVIITTDISVSDFTAKYVVDTTTTDITVTIPDSDASNAGLSVQVINNTGDYSVIIETVGGQNIGSLTSQTIKRNNDAITLTSYGNASGYIITQDSRAEFIENEITVAKSNAEFTTIKEALDSITDNSITQRYVILVSPAIYIENNPLQGKEYVCLKATGDIQTTRITALNPNEDLLTMSAFFTVEGFSFTDVVGNSNYAINQSVSGLTALSRCSFIDCSNGVLVNDADAAITLNDCAVFNLTATTIKGVYQQSGHLVVNVFTASLGDITTLIEVTGVNSTTSINNIRADVDTLTTGVSIKDLAQVDISGAKLLLMGTAIEAQGGSRVNLSSVRIGGTTVDGVRINDIGSNTTLNVQSTIVRKSTGYDFNILSATALVAGDALLSLNNVNFVIGSKVYGIITDLEEDDEGANILGRLNVGIAEEGAKSNLGESNSYTRGMLVYTETSGNAFVDVSANARSASDSTFTFTDITENSSIYVASSLENDSGKLTHYGIKTKMNTAVVYGTGNIIIEYWNGTAWAEVNGSEIDADGNFYPHGKDYFQGTSSANIRYSQELASDSWTENDPMGLGTAYYWVRFRISSDITTAPIFEQFKLHTNKSKFNKDGWIEYFGNARPIGTMAWDYNSFQPFSASPSNQDLYLLNSPVDSRYDIGVGRIENEFSAGALDLVGLVAFAPLDMDTSSPLKLRMSFMSVGTGDVEWFINVGIVKDGDPIATSGGATTIPREVHTSKIVSVPTANVRVKTSIDVDLSDVISRREVGGADEVWITIARDGGYGNDTLSGTANVIQISPTYTKWCEGGHV